MPNPHEVNAEVNGGQQLADQFAQWAQEDAARVQAEALRQRWAQEDAERAQNDVNFRQWREQVLGRAVDPAPREVEVRGAGRGVPIRVARGLNAAWAELIERKEDGKRGEELFQLILSGLREIYEADAVIAGGAVRDFAAGITNCKDVDVFVPLNEDQFLFGLEELGWQGPTRKVGDKYEKCVVSSTARYSSVVQHVPVDLIFMDEKLEQKHVDSFPVHAQRCIWTLSGGLVLSPEAQKDIDNKTFTIDPSITDKNKVQALLKKVEGWKARPEYKDWTIVKPETKEWWEAEEAAKKKDEAIKQAKKKTMDALYAGFWKE